jgi:hypothetical protein
MLAADEAPYLSVERCQLPAFLESKVQLPAEHPSAVYGNPSRLDIYLSGQARLEAGD